MEVAGAVVGDRVPLIATAARQEAELVVLPETLTYYGTRLSYAEVAEPVPGPATESLGRLAAELGVVIIASLFEKRAEGLYRRALVLAEDADLLDTSEMTIDAAVQRAVALVEARIRQSA